MSAGGLTRAASEQPKSVPFRRRTTTNDAQRRKTESSQDDWQRKLCSVCFLLFTFRSVSATRFQDHGWPFSRPAWTLPETDSPAQTADAPTFERDVRPILKTYCLDCHGGGEKLAGNLDLRLKRFAVKGGDTGPAIVPGNAAASLLIERMKSGEMPPIDAFVLAKLQARGLQFASEADHLTLIRRGAFDLTGLPRAPHEIEQFLKDQSADAYKKMIEQFLQSPQYGERWGRH